MTSDQTIHPCSVSGPRGTDYYLCGTCSKQYATEERASVGGAFSCANCERLADAAPDLLAACERADLALHDWLHQYAPEFCDADRVSQARSRITNQGGTIAYLSDIFVELSAAIAKAKPEPRKDNAQ